MDSQGGGEVAVRTENDGLVRRTWPLEDARFLLALRTRQASDILLYKAGLRGGNETIGRLSSDRAEK